MKMITKKPIYKDLAVYLNVSEQAVKQYPKDKRELMILGLWLKNENDHYRGAGVPPSMSGSEPHLNAIHTTHDSFFVGSNSL